MGPVCHGLKEAEASSKEARGCWDRRNETEEQRLAEGDMI